MAAKPFQMPRRKPCTLTTKPISVFQTMNHQNRPMKTTMPIHSHGDRRKAVMLSTSCTSSRYRDICVVAMKKVMTVITNTVTVSARRSPIIEPKIVENGVLLRFEIKSDRHNSPRRGSTRLMA